MSEVSIHPPPSPALVQAAVPGTRAFLHVAWEIGWRDVKANRRLSVVMLARYLLQPLIQAGLLWFLLVGVLRLDFAGSVGGYPSFVLTGLLAWGLVSTVVGGAAMCLANNAILVRRVAFPRQALVYAVGFQGLVQAAVTGLALVAVLLLSPATRPLASASVLLWLVPLFAILGVLSLGLALIVAAVSALLPNVGLTMPVVLQAWLYTTPIIYPSAKAPPWLAATFLWNPLAVIVGDIRLVILEGGQPALGSMLYGAVVAVVLWWAGQKLFRWCDPLLPDLM